MVNYDSVFTFGYSSRLSVKSYRFESTVAEIKWFHSVCLFTTVVLRGSNPLSVTHDMSHIYNNFATKHMTYQTISSVAEWFMAICREDR